LLSKTAISSRRWCKASRAREGWAHVDHHRGGRQRQGDPSLNRCRASASIIRASGDQGIGGFVRDADRRISAAASPVAENILKERIKSFGFRTGLRWPRPKRQHQTADFAVAAKPSSEAFRAAGSLAWS
jgi:hypothetical protein